MKDFGVICKGRSLLRIGEVVDNFDSCCIVNNIDRDKHGNQKDGNASEYTALAPLLKGKDICHFINRLNNAPLSKAHYRELRIHDVYFTRATLDKQLGERQKELNSIGLTCHLLPERLLEYNKAFPEEYAGKHPNTGLLAVTYAADIIRPKVLWVIGLDFYESDYIYRRPWQSPLKKQQEKMKRCGMKDAFLSLVKKFPEIRFHMVSDATFPEMDNLRVIFDWRYYEPENYC